MARIATVAAMPAAQQIQYSRKTAVTLSLTTAVISATCTIFTAAAGRAMRTSATIK